MAKINAAMTRLCFTPGYLASGDRVSSYDLSDTTKVMPMAISGEAYRPVTGAVNYPIYLPAGRGYDTAGMSRTHTLKEDSMREEKYTSGTFCLAIECAHHKPLEKLSGKEYLDRKAEYCKDCNAWKFYNWLRQYNWKVVRAAPEMSVHELAARIHGVDPERAKDMDIDEILCL
jgi:hypothetical protein